MHYRDAVFDIVIQFCSVHMLNHIVHIGDGVDVDVDFEVDAGDVCVCVQYVCVDDDDDVVVVVGGGGLDDDDIM